MPGGDGTGPNGMGSMTGRGLGFCAGFSGPGFTRGTPRGGRGFGRGFGMGFGRGAGRGFGRGFFFQGQPARTYPELTKDQEIADLKAEKELIQKDLDSLNKRLSELEKK